MGEEPKGFSDGIEESGGDPRVLLAMNAVLSVSLGLAVVWGLDLLGVVTYGVRPVAGASLAVFVLTYAVVVR